MEIIGINKICRIIIFILVFALIIFSCNGGGSGGDSNDSLTTWYEDSDGDGYGDPSSTLETDSQPTGYVSDNSDCDDTNQEIHPGATEICGDGIDQDCDGNDLACNGVGNGILRVNVNAQPGGDGTSWEKAFKHPQEAMDNAEIGNEIWVAKGTYKPLDSEDTILLTMKDGVALYGGFSATESSRNERDWEQNVTILDGYQDVIHVVKGASDALIDGFTITNGVANGSISASLRYVSPMDYNYEVNESGGGIINDKAMNLTIINCIFTQNIADYGGGIYNHLGSVTITNCSFTNNFGAGIYNTQSSPVITDCNFTGNDNAVTHGGGIENSSESNPTISGCIFSKNNGSAIANEHSSPTIIDCIFDGNLGGWGGGAINNSVSSTAVINCLFINNEADHEGGAISSGQSSLMCTNCTFANNSADIRGGGIFFYYSNDSDDLNIINSIFWGNEDESGTIEESQIFLYQAENPIIEYTTLQGWTGGWGGDGNIGDDPLFVGSDNFHLSANSPCIDTGTSNNAPDHDLEGSVRPIGQGFDMGVYEFTE